MRNIAVVTVARSDYGIYLPVLRKLKEDPKVDLSVIVSGMHLSPQHGNTYQAICADGFRISERVEMLLASDSPEAIIKSMGLGLTGFAQVFGRYKPDILIVLGDRFEMYCAALAALPFKIPVAHIHGGEITRGAIDDSLRHSMTKLSHLHFVSTDAYADRVVQMGEEPWRVKVSGAPSLDNLRDMELSTKEELESDLGMSLRLPPLLVTFHPVTMQYEETEQHISELLSAIDSSGFPVVFTQTNADIKGSVISEAIEEFVRHNSSAVMLPNLGTKAYFGMMANVAAMVGNSSSGIIEAQSLGLPVVNVGARQTGRIQSGNVIDVSCDRGEVLEGIRLATSDDFRHALKNNANLYDAGGASDIIIGTLKDIPLDNRLMIKRFFDLTLDQGHL